MTDFQSMDSAPTDRPVMIQGKAWAKARWHPHAGCWVYATDDPDYVSPVGFAPDGWRDLVGDEWAGVSFDPVSKPDQPRG